MKPKARKRKPRFDPKEFLKRVNGGRTVAAYRKNQAVYRQGDPADAVFYIQAGKAKVSVISAQGKEAVIAFL
jgi:CRP/FNR family transcriptional regulator, cyclic AMP receptor protein